MDFLKLIRYKNLLMVLLTMVLTKYALLDSLRYSKITFKNYWIYKSKYNLELFSDTQFILLVLSVLLITSSGYIINDVFDVETDKINKPKKLIIGKIISVKRAWIYYFLMNLFGLFLGIYLSFLIDCKAYSFFFIFTVLGLFLYSKYLKKKPLIGNLIVAIFIGFTILLVALFNEAHPKNKNIAEVINNLGIDIVLLTRTIAYVIFAFLTTFIREIIKDIEDINGDLKIKAKTLPIILGRKRASKVAFFFTCILLVFLLVVLQLLINEYLFLGYGIIFVLLPLGYFMYKLWFSENKKDFSKLSNLMKIIMLFGILSMLLFPLIT